MEDAEPFRCVKVPPEDQNVDTWFKFPLLNSVNQVILEGWMES